MRFVTSSGRYVTAATKDAAARMAAEYGMGAIVAPAPEAASAKPRRQMSVANAVRIFAHAQEWPQCGQGWPMDAQQRAAAAVIAANPGCTDDVF